jgi:hypothetical protein
MFRAVAGCRTKDYEHENIREELGRQISILQEDTIEINGSNFWEDRP